MFGMEQMVKNMLEEMGVDIPALTSQALKAYEDAQRFAGQMVQSQRDIHDTMKVLIDMQRVNAAKLDAILNHLNIAMVESADNGQTRIEFLTPQ